MLSRLKLEICGLIYSMRYMHAAVCERKKSESIFWLHKEISFFCSKQKKNEKREKNNIKFYFILKLLKL